MVTKCKYKTLIFKKRNTYFSAHLDPLYIYTYDNSLLLMVMAPHTSGKANTRPEYIECQICSGQ